MNKHTHSVSLIDGHIEDKTDAEIIKAYEKCIDLTRGCCGDDTTCPYCTDEEEGCAKCFQRIRKDVLLLLNLQQAEIERLQKLLSGAKDCIDEIEYAMNKVGTSNDRIDEALEEWNNLVKEMTEVSENG
jgi:hypothetical protein